MQITEEMIDAAYQKFSGKMLMREEDRELIKLVLEAGLIAQPTKPFAWYWHDATGCMYVTGDDRKADAPADALPLYNTSHPGTDPALIGVAEEIKESGGHWMPCTGCHDTEDGYPTRKYAYSAALQTAIGYGCHECGGLGAVWWHMTDEALAQFVKDCAEIDRPTENPQRALFEAAVVTRLKESGFLEIEIRTECLVRCDDGYQDEVINAGWHYWNTALEAQPAQAYALLADKHTGLRVDYTGLLRNARRYLQREPGTAEMLRQLEEHLTELGTRWYAGDTKVVDEILQLYCIETRAREAIATRTENGSDQA